VVICCLLIAIRWRLKGREESVMIGDLEHAYMVSLISRQVRPGLKRPLRSRQERLMAKR
jgi:predicted RNase H-like nuclease